MSTENTPKKQMSFAQLDDGTVRASFVDGTPELIFNPSELPEAIQLAAIVEGVISRLRGYVGQLEGTDRTPANMRAAVEKGLAALMAGTWKAERGTGAGAEFSIEIEAAWLFRKMKAAAQGVDFVETIEQTAALWANLTDDTKDADGKVTAKGQKAQVKETTRYAQAYAQVKAQRAAAKAAKLAEKAAQEDADSPF
jgi:hypothetical protein